MTKRIFDNPRTKSKALRKYLRTKEKSQMLNVKKKSPQKKTPIYDLRQSVSLWTLTTAVVESVTLTPDH